MQAYNASFSRKLNKGRPYKFKPCSVSYIETKKQELFEQHQLNAQPMNLFSLSFHLGKLTKEEYDVACFLEHLHIKVQKSIDVKRMPSSSAHTWNLNLQNCWRAIDSKKEDVSAENAWRKIKNFLHIKNPSISNEFFSIITTHYSYEELHAIKTGTYNITNILKEGLQTISSFINDGCL